MHSPLWEEMDAFIVEQLLPADPVLDDVQAACEQAGLPAISVSAAQGQMLHIFARMMGAKRILEIGTLGGYSTIWLARALPADGVLVSLELNPAHAAVAQANIARAGLAARVDICVGPALGTLAALARDGAAPFDFVFIDADKASNADYLEGALVLSRPGTLILADNVVRGGAVADPACADPAAIGIRRFARAIAGHPELTATALQTVDGKGYDGFALLRVAGRARRGRGGGPGGRLLCGHRPGRPRGKGPEGRQHQHRHQPHAPRADVHQRVAGQAVVDQAAEQRPVDMPRLPASAVPPMRVPITPCALSAPTRRPSPFRPIR